MPKRIEKHNSNFAQNMGFFALFAALFSVTFLISSNTLNAIAQVPFQSNATTVTQQQPPEPQQNQQVLSSPQSPQISWEQLEDAGGFIANGKIDSVIYTVNGKWIASGDWMMKVSDRELTFFNTTMTWHNQTSAHTHEFLNFRPDDDVNINSEEQTISVTGRMDIGTNRAISWPDVPSQIVIEKGKVITISLADEDTNGHFAGQSVHGNLTSLSICSNTPGPGMEAFPRC